MASEPSVIPRSGYGRARGRIGSRIGACLQIFLRGGGGAEKSSPGIRYSEMHVYAGMPP